MYPIRLKGRRIALAVATVLFVGASATIAAGGGKLILNGKVASTDVRTVNGSPYVKLSDMAKALGMVVVKRPGGYELIKAGGAGQVEGALQGKIGDTLFDGKWRFTVLGIETADSYTLKAPGEPYPYNAPVKYNHVTRVLQPEPGHKLIVIQCRIANGQKTTQTLWIVQKDTRTALADTKGESHAPVAHDVAGAPIQTQPLLPGAKKEFPLVFSVPQGTEAKDLIFTLRNNSSSEKGTDVRISLTPG